MHARVTTLCEVVPPLVNRVHGEPDAESAAALLKEQGILMDMAVGSVNFSDEAKSSYIDAPWSEDTPIQGL